MSKKIPHAQSELEPPLLKSYSYMHAPLHAHAFLPSVVKLVCIFCLWLQDRKRKLPIGEVEIIKGGRKSTIYHLRATEGFNWCSEIQLTTPVKIYGAVVSRTGVLVNVEDYIITCDEKFNNVSLNKYMLLCTYSYYGKKLYRCNMGSLRHASKPQPDQSALYRCYTS